MTEHEFNAPYRMPQSPGTLKFMCFMDTLLMPSWRQSRLGVMNMT